MSRVTNFDKATEDGFTAALNEELKELRRKIERQAEKYQRISVKTKVTPDFLEVPHLLNVVPTLAVLEIHGTAAAVPTIVWFCKPHTNKSVFIQSGTAGIEVDVVLRG